MAIIPMPILIHQQPSVCPNCHAGEYKIEVCKHCGYVYPQVGYRWYEHLMYASIGLVALLLIVLVVLFIMFAIFNWLDGMPLIKAIAATAKEFWKVLSNIY